MKKTAALLLALSTITTPPLFSAPASDEKPLSNPIEYNNMRYVVDHYCIDKEEGWMRMLEHLVSTNQIDLVKRLITLITKKQAAAFGPGEELLWRRFRVLAELSLNKINPSLMLDIMPKPSPSIIRPVLATMALGGFAYYLICAYTNQPLEVASAPID